MTTETDSTPPTESKPPAPALDLASGYASFFQAFRCEPIVYRILRSERGSFEDCILALCNDRKRLLKRIEELESIAPKKISTPQGVMIWHCPDDLVPLSGHN